MQVSNISFGKKIPVVDCQVRDNRTGKYIPVTMYEYDCYDQADIDEMRNLPECWSYNRAIANDMSEKKYCLENLYSDAGISCYVLKNKKNETIGITSVRNSRTRSEVKLIQTAQNGKYKYAGQAMLASLALIALNDRKSTFKILYPTEEAMDFYKKKCKFKKSKQSSNLEMDQRGMKNLVKRTESRTHGPIIDVQI